VYAAGSSVQDSRSERDVAGGSTGEGFEQESDTLDDFLSGDAECCFCAEYSKDFGGRLDATASSFQSRLGQYQFTRSLRR